MSTLKSYFYNEFLCLTCNPYQDKRVTVQRTQNIPSASGLSSARNRFSVGAGVHNPSHTPQNENKRLSERKRHPKTITRGARDNLAFLDNLQDIANTRLKGRERERAIRDITQHPMPKFMKSALFGSPPEWLRGKPR